MPPSRPAQGHNCPRSYLFRWGQPTLLMNTALQATTNDPSSTLPEPFALALVLPVARGFSDSGENQQGKTHPQVSSAINIPAKHPGLSANDKCAHAIGEDERKDAGLWYRLFFPQLRKWRVWDQRAN